MGSARIVWLLSGIAVLVAGPTLANARVASGASPFTLNAAASIGSRWGIVTSTSRTPQHNYRVGGARNSWHLTGRAIDIARRPGVRHADIEASYRNAGFVLIESLDEGDHSHFAFGARPGTAYAVRAQQRQETRASLSGCSAIARTSDAALERRRPDRNDDCERPEELNVAQSVVAAGATALK